jgi:DNA-directed RNA polymerase specialized sigma24 family protein
MRELDESELDHLMGRLAQGERDAFEPLFRALHPRALRFACARLGSDRGADAAQAALVRVFARASEFTPGRPVLPWFYAIVANEARALARRGGAGRQQAEHAAAAAWAVEPENPERLLVERELQRALERAVTSLDDASAETIAVLLGRSVGPEITAPAFRKRVSRAYARLRLLLGGFHGR